MSNDEVPLGGKRSLASVPTLSGAAASEYAKVQAAITALAGGEATFQDKDAGFGEWLYPEAWFAADALDNRRCDEAMLQLLLWLDETYPKGTP